MALRTGLPPRDKVKLVATLFALVVFLVVDAALMASGQRTLGLIVAFAAGVPTGAATTAPGGRVLGSGGGGVIFGAAVCAVPFIGFEWFLISCGFTSAAAVLAFFAGSAFGAGWRSGASRRSETTGASGWTANAQDED